MMRHPARPLEAALGGPRALVTTGALVIAASGLTGLLATERAAPAGGAPAPELVLLETEGRGAETTVTSFDLERGTARRWATVTHLENAGVRGGLVRSGDAVAVIADREPGSDRSWGSALFLVEPGRAAEVVCDRVRYGARPLTNPDGSIIYIERGSAGEPRRGVTGALREDQLELAQVDASATGAVTTLFRARGFELYPAAIAGDEVVVYLIDRTGAHLVGVGPNGRSRTILAQLAPFARDFSLRGNTVLFSSRDAAHPERHTIEEVELGAGRARRLVESARPVVAPWVGPTGEIAYFDGAGLASLAGGHRPAAIEVTRAVSLDGAWAAGWRYPAGTPLPDVVIEHIASGRLTTLPAGGRRHLEVVGFRSPR
jgi:hypothetical protein